MVWLISRRFGLVARDNRTVSSVSSPDDFLFTVASPSFRGADEVPPPRVGSKLQAQFPAWSISGYMKPTASYLAKQNHSEDLHFHRILRLSSC